jgi:H+-transporting ATPase
MLKPGEAAFSGSITRLGEIDTMVCITGANTFFGKTAQQVQEAHSVSRYVYKRHQRGQACHA